MTTLFPTLLMTGFALAVAPVLVHLLSRQQRRPVRWAAMEFLLESQAKNRTWINLKQWLLLASRVLALALAGLMVARPSLTSGLAGWLPGEPVHLVVLLDDSYSMSDQAGAASPWRLATEALAALATRAEQNGPARVTVVRSSRPQDPEVVPSEKLRGFPAAAAAWAPTEHAEGFAMALEAFAQEVDQTRPDERSMAYVLSDFRRRDLRDPERVGALLKRLADRPGGVTLVPCAQRRRGNLGIASLAFDPSPLVSGFELIATLAVTNHGAESVGPTTVSISADGEALPAIGFEAIPAGESAERTFRVRFSDPGEHYLTATLPDDAVAADNCRRLATRLPAERPVLLIGRTDEQNLGNETRVFAAALRPSREASAGWRPVVQAADSPALTGDLTDYAAVLLLDPGRLPERAVEAVADYTAAGGGVLVVLGENTDRAFSNRALLADADRPLIPLRLGIPTQTERDAEGRAPHLRSDGHPALRALVGGRSQLAGLTRVYHRHTLSPGAPTLGSRVIGSLSTGAPLLIESTGDSGRVLCLLTSTARPLDGSEGWSNLSLSPLFPVLVNELAAYAAAPRVMPPDHLVGQPWRAITELHNPTATRLERLEAGSFTGIDTAPLAATGESRWAGRRVSKSGVYRLIGGDEAAVAAVNVDPDEGDLSLVDDRELRRLFAGDGDLAVVPAEQLAAASSRSGRGMDQGIGVLLLGLLAFEQMLAFACSYHGSRPSERGAA